jgi:hypothetical protein
MPLDPSIILGAQPAPQQSPLQGISAIAQLQDVQAQAEQRRLAGEAARQKAMDDAQVRSVFAAAGGDTDAALKQLYLVNPRAAAPLAEQVGKARKEQLDAMGKDLDNQKKTLEHYTNIWGLVSDDTSLAAIRPLFVKAFPQLDPVLPKEYGDGSAVQRVSDLALSQKDKVEQNQKVMELFAKGEYHAALGNVLSRPDITPAKWDEAITGAMKLGVPKAVADEFGGVGGFSPANVENAARLAIPAAKRAELEGQAATRAQTESHQTTQEDLTRAAQAQTAARDRLAHADRMAALDVARERLTKTAGGRPVTSGDARRVGDFNDAREELATLADTVSTSGATGVSAQVGASMPNWVTDTIGWGTDAKKKQAVIDRAKQVIGKTLEGGVLRKEDEIKYTKILPTISDPPDIVAAKMSGLDAMIAQKRQDHLDALADAGYDVSKFTARPARAPLSDRAPASAAAAPDLTGVQPGHGRTFNSGPYGGQTWTTGPDGRPKRVS